MADAKIMTFGELFSATTDVIPDNKAAAVEIEGLDGNDYIKINTTNSSEAVQLVSSGIGRVSIGTHDPYTSINADADNLVVGDGTGNEGITIVCGSSAGDYGSIYFGDPSSGTQGQIRYEQNNEVMSFCTNTSERMRIDINGNVGIKITDPSANLHVTKGAGTPTNLAEIDTQSIMKVQARTDNLDTLHFCNNSAMILQGSDGANNSTTPKNISLQPFGGDVGIGTTTVAAKLDVTDGANDYTSGLLLRNGTSLSEATSLYHDNTGSTSTVLANRYGSDSAAIKLVLRAADVTPITALTALGNGKVGIGNDSPTKNLSIVNPDGEVQLELRSSAEDTNAVFYLGTPHDTSAVNKTAIIAKSNVGYSQSDLHFCLNNIDDNTTEVSLSDSRMMIDTDGNVGIGDTTPSKMLDIKNGASGGDILCYDIYTHDGGVHTSDERKKENITPSALGLDFINALNPVSYKWRDTEHVIPAVTRIDSEGVETVTEERTEKTEYIRTHYGLIAQEVLGVLDDAGVGAEGFGGYCYEDDRDQHGLRYNEFISPLIKAVQELSAQVKALKEGN